MEQSKIDWLSFGTCVAIIAAAGIFLAASPETAGPMLQGLYDFIAIEFGVFYLLARLYGTTGRVEVAEAAKRRFVDMAPDPATGYRTLGGLLARDLDLVGAEAAYRKALRIEPSHAPTQARLNKVLQRKQRN